MLFIPLEKEIDWKNPPFLTIALILVNTFCYFAFQGDDEENYIAAMNYYYDSGLADIEIPYYKVFVKNNKTNDNSDATRIVNVDLSKLSEKQKLINKYALLGEMIRDGEFLSKLESGEIIKKEDDVYKKWKRLRSEFRNEIGKTTFYEYGLQAYKPTFVTLITHMFLHANFEHLFGNMIFLFLFGYSVEMILGWRIYLFTYILAGIGSGLFYILLEPFNAASGIGASGAISGLTGMYTVLYGLRKIRFFYFAFVFFDTVKAPALIILPIWLGYEFYNHYFIPSNINNLAHAGGLISGAVIAFLAKKYHRNIDTDYMDENKKNEEFDLLYASAMNYVSSLQTDKAISEFNKLKTTWPDNIEVKKQLFNLHKFSASSDAFHNIAREIFSIKENSVQVNKVIFETYHEYKEKAKPGPKLTVDQLMKLAFRFMQNNYLIEAEKIIVLLLKNKVKHQLLAESLQLLSTKYGLQDAKKSKYYLNLRNTLFPK